jgi:hypothetical protein
MIDVFPVRAVDAIRVLLQEVFMFGERSEAREIISR